jgi:cell wall-associated NlpC family hydrolase
MEGLDTIQSRVAQLQALLGENRATGAAGSAASSRTLSPASGTDSTGFAKLLSGLGSTADGGAGGAGGAGRATSTGTMGEQAVEIARRYLGVPYRWGGTDPKTGLDCSGLTKLVYGQLGLTLPRTSGEQARTGRKVSSLATAQPGDLVFFGSPVHHMGMYIGDGKMLDAPHAGDRVRIRKVYEPPSAIRRVVPSGTVSAPAISASTVTGLGAVTGLAGITGLSNLAELSAAGLDGRVRPASGTSGLAALDGLTGRDGTGGLAGTPYADLFTAAGRRYGVDPALLSAVAKAESGYRASAVSGAGARGLMQLMPATARSLGVNPDVPAQAVDGAARLLADHLRTFNGRVDLALAAYNAGPGAVRKYGGIPPYAETRTYVHRVTKNWGDLR